MADPSTYRPAPGTIPMAPGVYKFRDDTQRVIYVGKAKNLRARLSNYFQDLSQLHPRTRQMVTTASSVEWTVVASEVEALQLEYTWIKKFDPHFNVKYRDDKTYPVLAVSVGERYPRAFFYRGPQRKGIRYFGPYSHAWAIRETLDLLIRVFPMRTCTKGVFNRHEQLGRPCLLGYIDKCAAPCVGRVSEIEHREIVDGFVSFMAGHTDKVERSLTQEMTQAAETLDFERAARLRDQISAIHKVTEQQSVVLGDATDADVIAVEADDLEASIQLFHVRSGRIRGQRGWVVECTDDSLEELIQSFIIRFYSDALAAEEDVLRSEEKISRRGVDKQSFDNTAYKVIPREILVNIEPADPGHVQEVLSELRHAQVHVRLPQRGDKRALSETVYKNAVDAFKQHKLKRVSDLTARSAALQEIQDYLGLDEAPLRIECTDISHIQGTDVVASLVVFEDGLPKKSDYRRYKIKEAAGDGHSNDVASIAEITHRRFLRHTKDKLNVPESEEFDGSTFVDETVETRKRFAYPPQLFIVDGGAPQVAAAQKVFDELGINDVFLIGIAKRLEEIWLPDDPEPLILPRTSQALFLFQHIRDEAHRFAISFHRQQRSTRMRHSELDDIKGLGQTRRTELVKHFGSVKKLKQASIAEIEAVKGFGPGLAAKVFAALHPVE
ncbi:UvrABC system protein C [Corynebacterium kutscheri]|uniref:UvrABC system protein C n=1 Tax=Corynebacterium kutscheri TaxID=35755 RepID=A0AB38VUD5_9CORY|nr:excinuclease ABC subunit UvrC [Corynebacterium kutscheri]VEH08564.1 UvrABC system protein C [Corynebacterium kutscheri]VEH79693.1 UvrABC system protein C [Corynebacterium kutscheri]